MNASPLLSKVVVDPSASRALLALAYQEGLLTESENNDHCLKSLASKEHPQWLTTQALEQVVLFDQLHLALPFAWRGVHGGLIEDGLFVPVAELRKPEGEIQNIDPGILNGLLKARGISPTPFEDPSILRRVKEALHKLEEWEKKHRHPPPDSLTIFMERFLTGRPSEPMYIELEEIRRPLQEFQPTCRAMQEYLEVVATAQDRDAFIMTPIYESASQQLFQPRITQHDLNQPTVLLRLTCSKLGVLPYGQSLGKTLRFAKDSATIALRVKIQEWADSLTEDSGADTERIQKEIAHALKVLARASVGSQVSNITTYLGIPVGLLGLVTGFGVALGWTCAVAGTIGVATSHATTHKYRWATFGSSNKD